MNIHLMQMEVHKDTLHCGVCGSDKARSKQGDRFLYDLIRASQSKYNVHTLLTKRYIEGRTKPSGKYKHANLVYFSEL